METQEPKQPELKATTFCMVCGTPCRMEPVTDNLDGEGSVSYKYLPTIPYATMIDLLRTARQYAPLDLNREINKILYQCNAL